MTASADDLFMEVGTPGTATTLSAPGYTAGGTSITVGSTSNWPTATGVIFAIDEAEVVDGVEVQVAGTYNEYEGTVDTGTSVTNVDWVAGSGDRNYSAGALTRVYVAVTSERENRLAQGMSVGHDQAGAHKASLPLTTPRITTSIDDSAGNEVIKTPATASAVNEITVTNAATGNAPRISATGGDSAIDLNLRGKGLAKSVTIGAGATKIYAYDYVASGCVITADSVGVNKNYSVSSGVVVINGNPLTVAAVSAQTVTASKDRYIDLLDNGDGTAVHVATGGNEVNNNAASPALAANSVRLGIVVAGATTIATTASINQGEETRVLPIASSIPYQVTDSLGNLICPRDPHRKLLGRRQIIANYTTTANSVDTLIPGLTCPVIVPTGRKVRITLSVFAVQMASGAPNQGFFRITEGTVGSGTILQAAPWVLTQNNLDTQVPQCIAYSSTGGSLTFNASILQGSAVQKQLSAAATAPAFISVELI